MGGRRACSPPRSGPRPGPWPASWPSSARPWRCAWRCRCCSAGSPTTRWAAPPRRPSPPSPPSTSPPRSAAPLLDLVVVWWSARVSWRAGNRLRERLAAHALRLEQAWHGRHSPGQLIERIDGDVEAMAIFFAGMAVQIAGNVALIAGHARRGHGHRLVDRAGADRHRLAGAAVMVRLRMAAVEAREARARGQRPALRRPRGAPRRPRGPAGQRRRALRRPPPARPQRPVVAGGPARLAAGRRRLRRRRPWCSPSAPPPRSSPASSCSSGASSRRRRAHALPLRRHAAPAARADRRAAQGVPEGDGRRPPGLDPARRPSPRVADGPDDGRPSPRARSRSTSTTSPSATTPTTPRPCPRCGASTSTSPAGAHLGARRPHGQRQDDARPAAGPLLGRAPGSGPVRVGGVDVRDLTLDGAPRPGRGRDPGRRAVPGLGARQPHAVRRPRRHRRRAATPCSARSASAPGWRRCPTASTPASPGGHGLSAGEGQLLAFARAFLADADVVVLDEASSRLDPVTERRIRGPPSGC